MIGGQGDPLVIVQEIEVLPYTKWYMHNSEYVLENETHKLLWDFEIQTDHIISARRPDLIIINKKERTCRIVDFGGPQSKIERMRNEG